MWNPSEESPIAIAKELARPYYLKWFYSRLFGDRYPAYFADCWNYPSRRLAPGVGSWLGNFGELPDVLFLPASDWHTRFQRSQHLAGELAQLGHRCFYLNPHLGREFEKPYLTSPRQVVSKLLPNVFELHVHLMREPVYHHRCLENPEIATIFSAIERLLEEAGTTSLAVIVSLPLWNGVAELLKDKYGCRVIYDCHDLWAGFGNFDAGILAAENDLFALSDSVLFSSRWLMDDKTGKHNGVMKKSTLLRNAVRAQDFDVVPRKRRTGRRIVGYSGSLDFWFDADSIRAGAVAHPEWDFVLFGRIEATEVHELGRLANVHLMGEVPYSTLRYHFSSIDVCVIPFRISPLTLATNPLKLYEYFACGHPVVSSSLPEVKEYGDLVYFANDSQQFVRQLEAAMAENNPLAASRRRVVAECESWAARCASLIPHFYEGQRRTNVPSVQRIAYK